MARGVGWDTSGRFGDTPGGCCGDTTVTSWLRRASPQAYRHHSVCMVTLSPCECPHVSHRPMSVSLCCSGGDIAMPMSPCPVSLQAYEHGVVLFRW